MLQALPCCLRLPVSCCEMLLAFPDRPLAAPWLHCAAALHAWACDGCVHVALAPDAQPVHPVEWPAARFLRPAWALGPARCLLHGVAEPRSRRPQHIALQRCARCADMVLCWHQLPAAHAALRAAGCAEAVRAQSQAAQVGMHHEGFLPCASSVIHEAPCWPEQASPMLSRTAAPVLVVAEGTPPAVLDLLGLKAAGYAGA